MMVLHHKLDNLEVSMITYKLQFTGDFHTYLRKFKKDYQEYQRVSNEDYLSQSSFFKQLKTILYREQFCHFINCSRNQTIERPHDCSYIIQLNKNFDFNVIIEINYVEKSFSLSIPNNTYVKTEGIGKIIVTVRK